MNKTAGALSILALSTAFYLLCNSRVLAQIDIDKATHETDRLEREYIQEKMLQHLEKPGEPLSIQPRETTPSKAETSFFVKKIELKGCELIKAEELSDIVGKYENKETTFSQLNKLTVEIEREYLSHAIIAAALIPEQELSDQIVIIQIVEARMGELKIQKHRYFSKKRLQRYWHVLQREILWYDELSKSSQLMNKNPDRDVKMALTAGEKPGTTDVILTTETRFPIHSYYSFDNEGTASTGKYRKGAGLRHNNFLGLDDILFGGYSFGKDFSGKYVYHNLPINGYGTNLLYGYSASESHPKRDYSAYGITSEAKNSSFALHQDLYNNERYAGEIFFSFDAKDKTTTMTTGTTNRDRLRILSLGGKHLIKGPGNGFVLSHELSQGTPWFGASDNDNPLASRNAKSVFTKFSLGANHSRYFAPGVQGLLNVKSQIASTKLAPQEEFSLGGIDSVRGYPSGDYLADNAFTASAQLSLPSPYIPLKWRVPWDNMPLRDKISFLLFSDYGWGERKGALSTEISSTNMWSLGLGWKIKLFEQVVMRMEWGFPLGNDPITRPANSCFHFSIDFQENIFSRIKTSLDTRPVTPKIKQN